MITSIEGLAQDEAAGYYWTYTINDEMVNTGAKDTSLTEKDRVVLPMRNFKPTKMSFSVQEIAYLALLVAASVVGRTLFQPLPNVQPMTAIFLLVALYLGCVRGLIVALLSLLITNFYMGMGIWTIAQAVSYTVVILMMSGLRHVPHR